MFKLIITIKKKKGMTLEQFMHHYDKVHIPLCQKIMPVPLHLHRRNYILTDHPFYGYVGDNRAEASHEPAFDVITEAFYEDEAAARASMDALFDQVIGPQVMEDEKNFCEPGGVNFYVVEVHQSAIPWGA
ncbi:EthD domain-containing protein [Sphingobium phenoxybenzoativorans]|uniref:EthD domain-containing protein n=1 Tax=Sphingobium phenoxybenzoativorans TaxID=1592790 RepID=UPI0009F4F63C|nr:EthD domain-containing protein [Sphingobium phenoxybenzoativorans]